MPDESTATVATMTAEAAEEYSQSLAQIFAGSYRQVLWAQQQGIPQALGLTTKEWVDERLGGYVRMHTPDRRKAVAELSKEGLSTRKIGEVLGASKGTIGRHMDELGAPNGAPEPEKSSADGTQDLPTAPNGAPEEAGSDQDPEGEETTPATADDAEAVAKTTARKQRDLKAEARRDDRDTREDQVTDVPAPDLREGRLKQALADVTGVDLVFTDPPYPREHLPAWSDLADWAAGALKPGALLVAYSGQYHLPEVIERLSRRLDYQWLGWLATTGPQVSVRQRPIMSGGKPLLVFSAGPLVEPYRSRRFFDAISSEHRTRDRHTWEQQESPAAYYIDALTERGELVVDPFLGSGTFAAVAHRLGRRVIGCDCDPAALNTTRQRIDEQS